MLQAQPSCLIRGIKCPFKVITPRPVRCNHAIDIDETSDEELIDDPLVKAMVPLPPTSSQLSYFEDPRGELKLPLLALSRMSWPIRSIVMPAWTMTLDGLYRELNATNVQPLVLTDAGPMVTSLIRACHQLAGNIPRHLIVTGAPMPLPSSFVRLKTELHGQDLNGIEWEGIGARLLREEMENYDG